MPPPHLYRCHTTLGGVQRRSPPTPGPGPPVARSACSRRGCGGWRSCTRTTASPPAAWRGCGRRWPTRGPDPVGSALGPGACMGRHWQRFPFTGQHKVAGLCFSPIIAPSVHLSRGRNFWPDTNKNCNCKTIQGNKIQHLSCCLKNRKGNALFCVFLFCFLLFLQNLSFYTIFFCRAVFGYWFCIAFARSFFYNY